MALFPFARQSSTHAPGSSYFVSNAMIKGMRHALGLEDPVRIEFDGLGKASVDLSSWCRRNSRIYVKSMQLRKESKAPFFHEYIAFRLEDDRYYRIDRRQLPNEGTPLDCTEDAGVEAYETIEQITDMDSAVYSPSDCLIQLDFEKNFRLEFLIDICREISLHVLAQVYTVQRYNCYFYAQTILLCILCKQSDWYENYIWELEKGGSEDELTSRMPLAKIRDNSGITIRVLDKQPSHLTPASGTTGCKPDMLPSTESNANWRVPLRMIRPRRNGSQSNTMKETDIGELQEYLSDMIRAHSLRVEQYKFLLKCAACDVEWDIKKAMNDIWGKKWLLLGQIEDMYPTLAQPVTSDPDSTNQPSEQKGGMKDESGSSKIGMRYDSWLKRRGAVIRRAMTTH
ncbi:unnamed protein product [Rhizoctonia solani]|uniref:Uncharacterized protein n=1 Tax=Rhizoctonia solani TaxID=456999 RepID=A0A8H3CP38_9AGAM|nr:unnamed protein product [Rhizoctonia solani]